MFRYSAAHALRASTIRLATLCGLGALCAGALTSSCLDREISTLSPETTNLFVTQVPNDPVDKIDLLFMIDNSASMADKQVLLSKAVPKLVERLVVPLCTDGTSREKALADGTCRGELVPEFRPVRDIHVGVISSSLGGFGSESCKTAANPTNDDRGHLIGTLRTGVTTYQGQGFLAWDPGAKQTPPGTADVKAFTDDLTALVTATGESGCGYEASLEAWYRFLVEPDPPRGLAVNAEGRLVPDGPEVDEELLAQRRAFLRPDSLVAIVMLSDENDCSVALGGQGQRVGAAERMPRGTAACTEVGPDDACCRPCTILETEPPPGCLPLSADPVCAAGPHHDALSDHGNVRCFEQKRRFGVDFLYPVERYITGLTSTVVPDRNGNLVPNPLFVDPAHPDAPPRSKGLVFLAGIVGVPWQDVATPESIAGAALEYLSAAELSEADRWPLFVGDGVAGERATDPFMVESIEPRPAAGINPITGVAIAPPTAWNPINGYDYVPDKQGDLQYACIFPLVPPQPCGELETCDCDDGVDRPLCRNPATGQSETTQHFAKAYPGLRQLEVLEGVGSQAIVASICPKVPDNIDDPSYGYNPAVQALIDRIGEALGGACLPRDLAVEGELGTVPCKVVEAFAAEDGVSAEAACAVAGRSLLPAELRDAVEDELREAGRCDAEYYPSCDAVVMCGIEPAQTGGPEALRSCQEDAVPSATGFCYVDATQGVGNPELVKECPATKKRLVRLVSADQDANPLPRKGATTFIACRGKAFDSAP